MQEAIYAYSTFYYFYWEKLKSHIEKR